MEQPAVPAKHGSVLRTLGIVCVGLFVLGVAASGIWLVLQTDKQQVSDREAMVSEITNLKDSTRQLQADNQKLQQAGAQPVDDSSVTTRLIRADCEAETGMHMASLDSLSIVTLFATANVVCENPQSAASKKAYMTVLKKVNGTWTLIAKRSTQTLDTTVRQKYGIPLSIK